MTAATTAVAQYTPQLHADRAVHAADRVGHRFGHGRRRDDELHVSGVATGRREPAGPGDRPGRLHLLAVDGERSGSDHAGQKSITFAMNGDTTAVAQYTRTLGLTVQSTPPTGSSIGSSTGDGGTTNYTMSERRSRDKREPGPRRRTRPDTLSRGGR